MEEKPFNKHELSGGESLAIAFAEQEVLLQETGLPVENRDGLLDQVPDAIISTDAAFRVRFWNRAAERLYGWKREDMIGKSVDEALCTQFLGITRDEAAAKLHAQGFIEMEVIHQDRSGQSLRIRSHVVLLKNSRGEITGTVGILRNIVESRQAVLPVEESKQQNEFLAGLIHSSSQPVAIGYPDGRLGLVNRAFEELTGYTGDELRSIHWDTVLTPPEWREMERQKLIEQQLTGEPIRYEKEYIRKDGSRVSVELLVHMVKDAVGEPRFYYSFLTDITARKQAEAERERHLDQRRLALDAAQLGSWHYDPATGLIAYDARFQEILGLKSEACLLGEIATLVHGEDLPGAAQQARAALEPGPAKPCQVVLRIEKPDVPEKWIEVHGLASFAGEGENRRAVTLVGTIGDITKRKKAETLLMEAKEMAEAANRTKDRFLATLSHELRTPLTPVLLAVGAMQREASLQPAVRDDLAMIKRNIELETKLIDDLLDLSRIASGKLQLEIEVFNLNETIRSVCELCFPAASKTGCKLELNLDESAGRVAADSARFQQVLWNLLKNAIKFTPSDGVIRVESRPVPSDRVEVRITDTGLGIPAEMLPRIFVAFEQGSRSMTRQFGGLGLGLAISKAVVEAHGGSIRAESGGLGCGAVFTVQLPRGAAGAAARAPVLPAEEQVAGMGLRVLIVEDHLDTARTMCRLLEKAGFSVQLATDVASALQALEADRFDVMVSDVGLPDGYGYEIMQQSGLGRGVLGIAVSGYGMEEDIQRSRDAGFVEHLVKPIDFRQLIAAIHRVIKNRG